MAVWPTELQQLVNADSFSYKKGNTVLSSEMDVGPQKKRRRFTKGVDVVDCSINISRSLYPTFNTFYETTIAGGALPFDIVHPMTGATVSARFVSEPDFRPLGSGGLEFRLTMQWEILP